jgi:hypothetical protein
MKNGYTKRPDFAPAAAGWGKQNQMVDLLRLIALFFCFSPLFFSFPGPPRRVEKNSAPKRMSTIRSNKNWLH